MEDIYEQEDLVDSSEENAHFTRIKRLSSGFLNNNN